MAEAAQRFEEVERVHAALAAFAKGIETAILPLTDPQLEFKPAKGWSIIETAEHVRVVNAAAIPALKEGLAALHRLRQLRTAPPRYGLVERVAIRLMSPKPPFRVPNPSESEPVPPAHPRECLEMLMAEQPNIAYLADHAAGFDWCSTRVTRPYNDRIRFRYGAYLEMLVQHQLYHLDQMRALRTQPGFPRA